MNLEDILALLFVILAASGAIALASIGKWKLWLRALLMFVVMVVLASTDEHLSRLLFHDVPHGTIFNRVCLITLGCIASYLLLAYRKTGA